MARRKAWEQSVRRPVRRRRESFCIFTEGTTEQLYFDDFNLPTLRVTCIGLGGGNAEHLLTDALSLMRLPKYSGYDHYCLVFDCDDNSQDELFRVAGKAEKSHIRWCFSNPCFEIWYLLHFVYRDSPTTPSELKRKLVPARIPGYTETREGVCGLLKDKLDVAVRNARRLLPPEERPDWKNRLRATNPSTNVDELVVLLRQKG
ncbi:MAG: RloB domain-containing protein [Victivallales bacterium]|nr:RloB domain-containing protein [Victivallales bacterium]